MMVPAGTQLTRITLRQAVYSGLAAFLPRLEGSSFSHVVTHTQKRWPCLEEVAGYAAWKGTTSRELLA